MKIFKVNNFRPSMLFLFFLFCTCFKNSNAQNTSINSPFANGFEKGFKEGYCYNTTSIYCNPAITPNPPMPRINENDKNYQDGFNRGFQTGLDLQRVEGGSGTTSPYGTNYSSIPNYKFNDYIPQISIEDYVNVLAYKQALFNRRVQWVQQRINGIYDLASNLLSNEGYNKIKTSIINFHDYVKSRNDLGDFADDRVISFIASSFKRIEKEVYDVYQEENIIRVEKEKEILYIDLLSKAFDKLETNPNGALELIEQAEKLNIKTFEPSIYHIKSTAYENLGMYELALQNKNIYLSSNGIEKVEKQNTILEKVSLLLILKRLDEGLTQLKANIFDIADNKVKLQIAFFETLIYYDQKKYENLLVSAKDFLSSPSISEANIEYVLTIKQLKSSSLKELGRYAEALTEINSAIEMDIKTIKFSLYATKGKILFALKDYKNAIREFIKYNLLDSKNADSFYYLGLCYKNLRENKQACENFKKAISFGSKEALEEYPILCK